MKLKKCDFFELVSDIIDEAEFEDRIQSYNSKYQGLISDDVLAHLIVDELGRNYSNYKCIFDLKAGTKASFFAVVTDPAPKIFVTAKGSTEAAEVHITDHTSNARLLLWDPRHIELVKDQSIAPGIKLKLINAKITRSTYGTGVDISPEKFETLILNPKDYPEMDELFDNSRYIDISDIDQDGPVNLVGAVSWISKLRTFSRKDRSNGHVLNLDIYDGTGKIRITLWDEHAINAEEFRVGDQIKIIDGYSKLHNQIREVHSSYRTRIFKE